MEAVKEFTFDSSHQLNNYNGKCANLHGHTYRLQVGVTGKLNEIGFVIDFTELKGLVKSSVLNKLDHKHLNDIIPQPTAEYIALWIWKELETEITKLKNGVTLSSIQLWETPTSFVKIEK